MSSFFANFFRAGGESAVQSLQNALIDAAPDMAGTAQTRGQVQDLDALGLEIAGFRKDLRDATAEFTRVHLQYDELVGAAEVLSQQVTALDSQILAEQGKAEGTRNDDQIGKWTEERTSKSTSLNGLLDKIEHLAGEHDRDKARVEKLTKDLHTAEELYKTRAKEAVSSTADLNESRHDLSSALHDKELAARDAERAQRLAGLSTRPATKLNAATDHFRDAAEKARAETEALNLKTQTLDAVHSASQGDPNIAAAIAMAKGSASVGTMADRLAGLRR